MATEWIRVGARRLAFDSAGSGPPLILIAGLAAPRQFWWKQTAPLSDRFRVIALDNRDSGGSDPSAGPYGIEDLADDVAGIITGLGLVRAHLLGISMGGFVALLTALRHPEAVDRLVLVSTTAGGSPHIPAGPELDEVIRRVEGEDAETRMHRILPFLVGPGFCGRSPEDADRYVETFRRHAMADEPYGRQMDAIGAYLRQGVAHRVAEITSPTLIIHGDADRISPVQNGRYLADHIPGARLSIYEDVGHLPPIEAAQRFNAEILAFVR